jgi:hypothetical protein
MPRSKYPFARGPPHAALAAALKRPREDPPTDSPPPPPTLTVDVALANGTKAAGAAPQGFNRRDDEWVPRSHALFADDDVPGPHAGPGRGTAPRCVVPKKVQVLQVVVETRVPEGCVPGDTYHIRDDAFGIVRVCVPAGSEPGDKIRVKVTPTVASRCEPEGGESSVCVLD